MKKTFYIIMAVYLVLFAIVARAQNISTIAGNNTLGPGYSGDGGAATAAKIYNPNGVVADISGNIYIADYNNHVIRKINTSGIISTYAGTGTAGYSGDGGAATAATLKEPWGLAIDPTGNLYVSEYNNYVIRKITTSGIISTYAGTGISGYSGDGSAATAGKLYRPSGICLDGAGNLYIADTWNHAIRMISTTGIISTIAGTGIGGYSGDGAAATAAKLQYPMGVAITSTGKLYIADYSNNVIREVTTSTGNIATVAGNNSYGYSGDGGAPTFAQLANPTAVAIDPTETKLYISDQSNNRIRKVTNPPNITTCAGTGVGGYSGDGGPATSAEIRQTSGIFCDALGNLFICDKFNQVIRKVTPTPIPIAASASSFCIGATITFTTSGSSGTWSSSNPSVVTVGATSGIVTGVATGTAYIYYSDGTDLGVVSVTVNPTPAMITGTATLCSGSTTTLANATPGGSWSSSSSIATVGIATGIVSGVTAGTSTITYTISGGCYVTAIVTVNPLPDAGTISGASSVCESSTITLSNAATGGTWSSSNSAVASISGSGVVSGVLAGTATISYISTNSCGTANATYAVTVDACPTAIRSVSSAINNTITVFPNPIVAGQLTIDLHSGTSQPIHIIITNTMGAVVKEAEAMTNSPLTLDLNVPGGVYFLSAITGNGRYQAKIIVQ